MTDISRWLDPGETILKKQSAVLDQGFGNQSDGTLFLTSRQLVFQISQSSMMRGLDLKVEGQKDVPIEFIWIPLEYVNSVYKKGQAVQISTGGSLFQESVEKRTLFSPKGQGRVFENGPSDFKFALMIFTDKDSWVNQIITQRDKILANQPEPVHENKAEPVSKSELREELVREKIIIKEVVKVKCQYCGTLNNQGLPRCPHCGGRQ